VTVVDARHPPDATSDAQPTVDPGRTANGPPASTIKLAGELLGTVARIRRTIRRRAERPVLFSKLTGSQLELIRAVQRRPGTSVAEAAVHLQLAPNTVSTLVRELTSTRLLVREPDPTDRRVARLDLDPTVREEVDAWSDLRVVVLGRAVDRLSARDRRRLDAAIPVLERLAREVELEQAP
jgi:DNA-binding MarR family transcriptional regulator